MLSAKEADEHDDEAEMCDSLPPPPLTPTLLPLFEMLKKTSSRPTLTILAVLADEDGQEVEVEEDDEDEDNVAEANDVRLAVLVPPKGDSDDDEVQYSRL